MDEHSNEHAFGTSAGYGWCMNDSTSWLTAALPGEHHAYLLRIWRHGPRPAWRIMAEAAAGGGRHHFVNLEELCAFLQGELGTSPAPSDAPENQTAKG
jgi:hypothetical protein